MPDAKDEALVRLVKLASDVLPSVKCVALVDGKHDGISVVCHMLIQGRDRSYTPRLRLPSMEVSKHHASIFAIFRKSQPDLSPCFSVTDTGSTHGTFVYRPEKEHPKPIHPSSVHRIPEKAFYRLSPAKHASRPFHLQHLDVIRFGIQSNLFEVHMHGNAWASCPACQLSPDGVNEISLTPQARTAFDKDPSKLQVGKKDASKLKGSKHQMHLDSRKHLKALKDMYVKPIALTHNSVDERPMYRDRASVRRERFQDLSEAPSTPSRSEPTVSATPAPLDASNVGYRLLAKMANGAARIPDQAPIAPRVGAQRAGIGSTPMIDATEYGHRYQDKARASAKQRYGSM